LRKKGHKKGEVAITRESRRGRKEGAYDQITWWSARAFLPMSDAGGFVSRGKQGPAEGFAHGVSSTLN